MISEALGLALEDEDFAVTTAATGEDGLELLEFTAVDVVLLDLMLPGIDGLTVCRARARRPPDRLPDRDRNAPDGHTVT